MNIWHLPSYHQKCHPSVSGPEMSLIISPADSGELLQSPVDSGNLLQSLVDFGNLLQSPVDSCTTLQKPSGFSQKLL
jgi:hypothetical protein